jgi:hypothetical protein
MLWRGRFEETLLRFWNCSDSVIYFVFIPPLPERGGVYTVLPLSVLPSIQDIFLSNCWWQKSDIWSQASYRYTILWVAFLDPSDSYFLFAKERGYHRWALAHSSSCFILFYLLVIKYNDPAVKNLTRSGWGKPTIIFLWPYLCSLFVSRYEISCYLNILSDLKLKINHFLW